MKKILFALTLTFTAVLSALPIAIVDMEAVLAHHPNTPNDKKLLEDTLADFTKERDALREALKAKQADFDKQLKEAQNPMLAPAKVEELRKQCEAKYAELQQESEAAERKMASRSRELSDLEARLVKRTAQAIQAQIAAYAKEKGYSVVVYKNAVAYSEPTLDITNPIIVLCGGQPDKVDKAKESKELKAPEKLNP